MASVMEAGFSGQVVQVAFTTGINDVRIHFEVLT
jgi:hypothetical protein